MTTHFANFLALSGLVELFLILGTVFITVTVGILGHLLLKVYGNTRNMEFETIGPMFIIILIALSISALFNEIFEISADTMLHCYILDETKGSGFSNRRAPT